MKPILTLLCFLISSFHVESDWCDSAMTSSIQQLAQHLETQTILLLHTREQHETDLLSIANHVKCFIKNKKWPVKALALTFEDYLGIRRLENATSKRFHNPINLIIHPDQHTRRAVKQVTKKVILSDANWLFFIEGSFEKYFSEFHVPFDMMLLVANITNNLEVNFKEVFQVSPTRELTILHYGTWTLHSGLDATCDSIHMRRKDLNGIVLRTGSIHSYPLHYFERDQNGFYKLQGYFPKVWKLLEEILNFTSVNYPSIDNFTGIADENGEWDGLIGMITRDEIDVAIASFIMDKSRTYTVEFTKPLLKTSYQLFFKKRGNEINWDAILRPFTMGTWKGLFASCCVGSLTLATCHYCGVKWKYEKSSSTNFTMVNSFLFFLKSVCCQGHSEIPSSYSSRIIVLSAYLVAGVLLPSYSASLISYLTTKTPSRPFDSLEGLLRDGTYKLQTNAKSAEYVYFKQAQDTLRLSIYHKLMTKIKEDDLPMTTEQALERVCADPGLAHFGEMGTAYYPMIVLNTERQCDIITLSQPIGVVYTSMALARNSPYKKTLNYYLQKMEGAGLIRHAQEESFPLEKVNIENKWTEVNVYDVAQIFAMLLVGALISVITLTAEVWTRRKRLIVPVRRRVGDRHNVVGLPVVKNNPPNHSQTTRARYTKYRTEDRFTVRSGVCARIFRPYLHKK